MKRLLFIGIITLLFCNYPPCMAQINRLNNTKWVYDDGDCQEFLEFGKKNNYKYFSCETRNTIYGKYTQRGNEVILSQLRSEFDKGFHKAPKLKIAPARFKLLIDKDNMKYIVRWDVDNSGNWVISKFDSEYVYVKK
jgi:hypothetical protein